MAVVVIPDRRFSLADSRIYCCECWEPISFHHNIPHTIVKGRSTGWLHVRTGQFECSPKCDICGKEGSAKPLQRLEFKGDWLRWENQAFACEKCRATYQIRINPLPPEPIA